MFQSSRDSLLASQGSQKQDLNYDDDNSLNLSSTPQTLSVQDSVGNTNVPSTSLNFNLGSEHLDLTSSGQSQDTESKSQIQSQSVSSVQDVDSQDLTSFSAHRNNLRNSIGTNTNTNRVRQPSELILDPTLSSDWEFEKSGQSTYLTGEKAAMLVRYLRYTFRLRQDQNQQGTHSSYNWRISQLTSLLHMIQENHEAISDAIMSDFGGNKMRGFSEIGGVVEEINLALKKLKGWMKEEKVSGSFFPISWGNTKTYIKPEPKGVILIIGPSNFPVLLLLQPLVSAIAAGNNVVLKPSELAPASGELMKYLIPIYMDNSCIKVVVGGVEETTSLLNLGRMSSVVEVIQTSNSKDNQSDSKATVTKFQQQIDFLKTVTNTVTGTDQRSNSSQCRERWDHIFYTGSTKVGKIVSKAAAATLTPVTLELGGRNPCIIDQTITGKTMDSCVDRICLAKFQINCGQICIAPDHVYIHQLRKEEFVQKMKKRIGEMYGRDDMFQSDSDQNQNLRESQEISDQQNQIDPESQQQTQIRIPEIEFSKDYCRMVQKSHADRLRRLIDTCGGEVVIGGSREGRLNDGQQNNDDININEYIILDNESQSGQGLNLNNNNINQIQNPGPNFNLRDQLQGSPSSRFIAPTVIVDPDVNSDLLKQEIFGPVLPVLSYNDLYDDIIMQHRNNQHQAWSPSPSNTIQNLNQQQQQNQNQFNLFDDYTLDETPLALYYFTNTNLSNTVTNTNTQQLLDQFPSGGVCINTVFEHAIHQHLPFGGLGSSGQGSYHGKKGFDEFSHMRSILYKPNGPMGCCRRTVFPLANKSSQSQSDSDEKIYNLLIRLKVGPLCGYGGCCGRKKQSRREIRLPNNTSLRVRNDSDNSSIGSSNCSRISLRRMRLGLITNENDHNDNVRSDQSDTPDTNRNSKAVGINHRNNSPDVVSGSESQTVPVPESKTD